MLLSHINRFFNKNISLEQFKKEVELEIFEYKKGLEKKGSSTPIFLKEDIQSLLVKEEDVTFLCELFILGKLDKWQLNYIAEALLLSERIEFENNKIEDALLALSDPEYYNLINVEFVKDILNEFNTTSEKINKGLS